MSPTLAALIPLLEPLAEEVIKYLTAAVHALNAAPPTLAEMAGVIVAGMNNDHPDWTGEQRRVWALDALRQWTVDAGQPTPESTLNLAIELAVTKLKGPA